MGGGRVFHKKPEPLLLKEKRGSRFLNHHGSTCCRENEKSYEQGLIKKESVDNMKSGGHLSCEAMIEDAALFLFNHKTTIGPSISR